MKPVLFELSEARRLVKHYQFLKGQIYNVGESEYRIDHIVIAPSEENRFTKFLELFYLHLDNDIALSNSGFNSTKVQIILLEDDPNGGLQVYSELDNHLTKNKIAKVYDVDLSE